MVAQQIEKLTEAEWNLVVDAIRKSWNYIAYDWLQMCGGECTREEAWEGAFDASRPVDHGGLSLDLYEKAIFQSDEDDERMMREVFTWETCVL